MLLSSLVLALCLPGLPHFQRKVQGFPLVNCLIYVVLLGEPLQNNVLNAITLQGHGVQFPSVSGGFRGPWGAILLHLRRQKSRMDWTLTETCRASVAVFLRQTRAEGWILPWLISVLKQSTPFALCPVHLCVFRLVPPVSLCFVSWWGSAGARGNKHGLVRAPNTSMSDSRPCCAVRVIYLLPKRPCRILARPVPVNCACLSL